MEYECYEHNMGKETMISAINSKFEELDLFGEIPTSKQLTYEGLLLLTSDLLA